jgi:hypothetical protein
MAPFFYVLCGPGLPEKPAFENREKHIEDRK